MDLHWVPLGNVDLMQDSSLAFQVRIPTWIHNLQWFNVSQVNQEIQVIFVVLFSVHNTLLISFKSIACSQKKRFTVISGLAADYSLSSARVFFFFSRNKFFGLFPHIRLCKLWWLSKTPLCFPRALFEEHLMVLIINCVLKKLVEQCLKLWNGVYDQNIEISHIKVSQN